MRKASGNDKERHLKFHHKRVLLRTVPISEWILYTITVKLREEHVIAELLNTPLKYETTCYFHCCF